MADDPTDNSNRLVDTDDLGQEARSTGAEMGPATLAGVAGIGTLQIVRNRDGEVLERRGSWRLAADADDPEAKLPEEIRAAAEGGGTLAFEGPIDDPDSDDRREKLEVRVTSLGRYPFDRGDDEGDGESVVRQAFVNFAPVDDTVVD